jgi:hypothetical protein
VFLVAPSRPRKAGLNINVAGFDPKALKKLNGLKFTLPFFIDGTGKGNGSGSHGTQQVCVHFLGLNFGGIYSSK